MIDYNRAMSPTETNEPPKSFYIHENGHKISDESFKLMQRCLNGLEKAKHIANQSNAMQELSQIQHKIFQTIQTQEHSHARATAQVVHDPHQPFANNSDEKMSVQSPQELYRNKRKARKKTKQTNNTVNTTNINHISISNHMKSEHPRRQLSFSSSVNDMSSPQIIAKQQRKLHQTSQEIDDLHHELDCVYKTLNVAQKHRNKLFQDMKTMRKEHTEQIKSIMRQYTQFKQQTNLYEKEKQEIEYDLQQQSKYNQNEEQPLAKHRHKR
eukprot:144700_1